MLSIQNIRGDPSEQSLWLYVDVGGLSVSRAQSKARRFTY